jgi:hypothetical protein
MDALKQVQAVIESCCPKIASALDCVQNVGETVVNACIAGRERFIRLVSDTVPMYRNVCEKIENAVPEAIVTTSAITGAKPFIPLCYMVYHAALPVFAVVQKIASGTVERHDFTELGSKIVEKFDSITREKLTPALFVAFSIHSVVSLVKGIFCGKLESALFALAVAIPIASIAFRSMTTEETESVQPEERETPSAPLASAVVATGAATTTAPAKTT